MFLDLYIYLYIYLKKIETNANRNLYLYQQRATFTALTGDYPSRNTMQILTNAQDQDVLLLPALFI